MYKRLNNLAWSLYQKQQSQNFNPSHLGAGIYTLHHCIKIHRNSNQHLNYKAVREKEAALESQIAEMAQNYEHELALRGERNGRAKEDAPSFYLGD